jgi:ribosome-associated toxin RatA of RatAB toxin-antitoxin module
MRQRSPSGSYSKAERKLTIAAETSSSASLLVCKLRKSLSLAFCALTFSSLVPSSLAPCAATEPATAPTTSANNATNSASKDGASTALRKSSGKHEKGLIAHVQPSAQADESQNDSNDKSDDKSGKEAGSDEATGRLNNVYASQYFDKIRESRKRKYAHASSTVQIYAPEPIVWEVLIDFEQYPKIFKRMDTCHITKREHGLLFAETYLKPQMFVKKLCQHTVTDVSQGPHFLQWKMLDGNFSSVYGSWTLSQEQDKKGSPVCTATYTLEADPGPVIPGPMVSFILHQLEHEVVSAFKKACENTAADKADKGDKANKADEADKAAKKAVKN